MSLYPLLYAFIQFDFLFRCKARLCIITAFLGSFISRFNRNTGPKVGFFYCVYFALIIEVAVFLIGSLLFSWILRSNWDIWHIIGLLDKS